jgi:hypothetical protein
VLKSRVFSPQVHKVNNTAYLEFAEDLHLRVTKHFLLKESRMNRRTKAFAVAAFLTVAAAACDTATGLAAPEGSWYNDQQAPPKVTDSTSIPQPSTEADTVGRGGGGFMGSGH